MDIISLFERGDLENILELLNRIIEDIKRNQVDEQSLYIIANYHTDLEEDYMFETVYGEIVIIPPDEALRFIVSRLLATTSYLINEGIEHEIDFSKTIIEMLENFYFSFSNYEEVWEEAIETEEIIELVEKIGRLGIGAQVSLCYDTPYVIRLPFVMQGQEFSLYDPAHDSIYISPIPVHTNIHPYAQILHEFGHAFHNRLTLNLDLLPPGFELIFSNNAALEDMREGFADGFSWTVSILDPELKNEQYAPQETPEYVQAFALDYFLTLCAYENLSSGLEETSIKINETWAELINR